MAQLMFYDKGHIYELDGVAIPSVSEILRFMSREEYADINQYTLDNAADRGKAVHKACEEFLSSGECEVDIQYAGYMNAFVKFTQDKHCECLHSEIPLACTDFAGTIDLVARIDGELSIVDMKTVCAVKKTLVKAQLNAYKRLYEANYEATIERLYCLQLMSDGRYRLYRTATDSTEFDACLLLHKAMARKHKRGEIN